MMRIKVYYTLQTPAFTRYSKGKEIQTGIYPEVEKMTVMILTYRTAQALLNLQGEARCLLPPDGFVWRELHKIARDYGAEFKFVRAEEFSTARARGDNPDPMTAGHHTGAYSTRHYRGEFDDYRDWDFILGGNL